MTFYPEGPDELNFAADPGSLYHNHRDVWSTQGGLNGHYSSDLNLNDNFRGTNRNNNFQVGKGP